jgi:hypothetical protein
MGSLELGTLGTRRHCIVCRLDDCCHPHAGNAASIRAPVYTDLHAGRRWRACTRSAPLGPRPVTGTHGEAPESTPSPPRQRNVAAAEHAHVPASVSQSHGRLLDSYGRGGRGKGERTREEERRARGGATNVKATVADSLLPSLPRRNLAPRNVRTGGTRPPPSSAPSHRQRTGSMHTHQCRPHATADGEFAVVPRAGTVHSVEWCTSASRPRAWSTMACRSSGCSSRTCITCSRRLDTHRDTATCRCSWTRARTACCSRATRAASWDGCLRAFCTLWIDNGPVYLFSYSFSTFLLHCVPLPLPLLATPSSPRYADNTEPPSPFPWTLAYPSDLRSTRSCEYIIQCL